MGDKNDLLALRQHWRKELLKMELQLLRERHRQEELALGKRIDAMLDVGVMVRRIETLGFQFKPGDVKDAIAQYNQFLKDVAQEEREQIALKR